MKKKTFRTSYGEIVNRPTLHKESKTKRKEFLFVQIQRKESVYDYLNEAKRTLVAFSAFSKYTIAQYAYSLCVHGHNDCTANLRHIPNRARSKFDKRRQ